MPASAHKSWSRYLGEKITAVLDAAANAQGIGAAAILLLALLELGDAPRRILADEKGGRNSGKRVNARVALLEKHLPLDDEEDADMKDDAADAAVSYTHLTLPTILLV